MFVFNIKLKSKQLFKTILIVSLIIAISLFLLAGFKIITGMMSEKNYDECEIPSPEVAEISPENYTNILKEVHENIDTYVGQKISFTGYVYRVADLNETQTVVVGFLSEFHDIKKYENNTWIKITGEIKKGYYYGDIPYIEVTNIENVQIPDNPIVPAPSETYIPTSIIY